jgi:hypothetical protein
MKATPVLNYAVPESVKDLQEKMHGKAAEQQAACTCNRSSNVTFPPPCQCGCGEGYSTFL